MVFKTHFSSSSFNVVSFSLLELDVIWVASTIFHSLPYLPWCSTFSCLLPLPYCRSSLGYLWALYLPPPAPLLSYVCYSHPYVLHDQTISTTPHPLLTSSLVILSCILLLTCISVADFIAERARQLQLFISILLNHSDISKRYLILVFILNVSENKNSCRTWCIFIFLFKTSFLVFPEAKKHQHVSPVCFRIISLP